MSQSDRDPAPDETTRTLDVPSEALRDAQPSDDVDARRWRAAVEQRLFGKRTPPQMIGRYTILSKLGEGAHGTVYEAFDPQLERAVALKLVRIGAKDADAVPGQRLLQEARSLARLKHPHVVAVHDVGWEGRDIFIAMELVEGTTLRRWFAQRTPPRFDRIMDVFVQAARGLEAAHQAGLVHRDFKPENVLVGDDGRVRVSDFGLAESRVPDDDDAERVRPGMIVGTPAYMSPEQRAGEAADHRSDQFSFCVALLEALKGRRPDLARIDVELDGADARRIPRWLRRLLHRGLSRDPAARFVDMGVLLRELDRGRQRWRRRTTASVLAVLVLCAAAIVVMLANEQEPLCDPAGAAELWSEETVDAAREAFSNSGVAGARETWTRIDAIARARVEAWGTMAEKVCTGRSQDRARALCLGWQLHELRAFGAAMATADARVVEHALVAVHALPEPSRCGTTHWDPATMLEEGDPDEIATLHTLVANARVRLDTGQLVEALHASGEALARAQTLGWRALEAEALLVRGRAAVALHGGRDVENIDPETTLYAAMVAAESGRHPAVVLGALVELTNWAVEQRRSDNVELWSRRALRMLEQMPEERRLAARLHWSLSVAEAWHNRLDTAYIHLERAVALVEDTGSDPLLWRLLNQSGEIAYAHADYARARRAYEQALAHVTEHVGDDHLWVADLNGNLGEVAAAQDRLDDARAHFERALRIRRVVLGPDSYWVLHTLAHLGDVHLHRGDLEEAQTAYEAVLASPIADDPAGCDREVWARHGLALVALERGDPETSLRIAEPTRGRSPKTDPSHLDLCDRFDVPALALLTLDRADEALALLEDVRPRVEASAGREHRVVMPLLVAEAEVLRALGRDAQSQRRIERAMAIDTRDPANAPDVRRRARRLAGQ